MISLRIFFLTPVHRPDELSINIVMMTREWSTKDVNFMTTSCRPEFFCYGVAILPDSNHSLDERCHLVGSIVCPTLRNNVGSTSYYIIYILVQHQFARWPNVILPTVDSVLVQRPQPNKPYACQRNANHPLSICIGPRLKQSSLIPQKI